MCRLLMSKMAFLGLCIPKVARQLEVNPRKTTGHPSQQHRSLLVMDTRTVSTSLSAASVTSSFVSRQTQFALASSHVGSKDISLHQGFSKYGCP